MKDERLYAKFTLDFPDHPKIMLLSTAAKWALVELTIYSRRHLTDGFVSKPVALAKHGADVCQELASNDPENPSLIEVENGYLIHDFARHQSTKAEIEELTSKRKRAGQKGGQARAKASAKQVLKQTGSKSKPETETETEETSTHVGSYVPNVPAEAEDSPSAKFTRPILRDEFHAGRDTAEAAVDHQAAAIARRHEENAGRAAAARAAIADCDMCDDRGYVGGRVCDHDPETPERAARGIAAARAAIKKTPDTEEKNS